MGLDLPPPSICVHLSLTPLLPACRHHKWMAPKDLRKVSMWQLEWDSNLRRSRWKAPNPTTESSCLTNTEREFQKLRQQRKKLDQQQQTVLLNRVLNIYNQVYYSRLPQGY